MKTLLATTMALGVVFMLEGSQSASATVIQPAAPAYHQAQIVQAHWHGGHGYGHRGYYGGRGWGGGYYDDGPYYGGYYDDGPALQVGPLRIF